MIQDTEVSPKKTLAIKFVGVSFESTNYKAGQDELNESLCQGYRIVAEYPTSAGIVFSLSKTLRNHEREINDEESWRRNHWRSNHREEIIEEESLEGES